MINKDAEKIDNIRLSIPKKAEYVSVVRLTASAVASRLNFDIEEVEDIKVAIAEACINTFKNQPEDAKESLDIQFDLYSDKLVIIIKDLGKGLNVENVQELKIEDIKEEGLGIFIINSLMDEVEIHNDEGENKQVVMTKYIKDDMYGR